MAKRCIETSIVSYLTARPSADMLKPACQQITRSWWDHGRLASMACISPYVVEEASAGGPQAASERIEALHNIPVLPVTDEIPDLAEFLLAGGGSPDGYPAYMELYAHRQSQEIARHARSLRRKGL